MPASERHLVVKAWFTVSAVRLLLWVVPYRWLDAWLLRSSPSATRSEVSTEAIALSVERASRFVPGATCLVQALSGGWLIRRAGGQSTLRFGVAKDGEGFKAHAWLESDGRILIGGGTAPAYLPLTRSDDARR